MWTTNILHCNTVHTYTHITQTKVYFYFIKYILIFLFLFFKHPIKLILRPTTGSNHCFFGFLLAINFLKWSMTNKQYAISQTIVKKKKRYVVKWWWQKRSSTIRLPALHLENSDASGKGRLILPMPKSSLLHRSPGQHRSRASLAAGPQEVRLSYLRLWPHPWR